MHSRRRFILAILLTLLALGVVAIFVDRNSANAQKMTLVAPWFGVGGRNFVSALTASAGSYPNCRFGVGQSRNVITSYDISLINPGWYVNWSTHISPPKPGGIEFAQMLHVAGTTYLPSPSVLAGRVAANPGSLWLVANEPDCIFQDNVLPQEYAQAYHDAYIFIKEQDPTARVAVGGIVQPTPLRIEYLNIVLDTYAALYGEPLPTDAWHIHSFILREASCAVYPDSCWGSEIPPGIDDDHGMLYKPEDTDRLDIFQDRIVQFRQWMRDRGYRNKPLIITEYGTLFPHHYEGWDEERGRIFMYGTFDFLLTAKDPDLGYPPDENRLVQRWLWYSLDDTGYGGTLFDPVTHDLLPMGTYFGDYTATISPTVDLFAVDVKQVGPVPRSLTRSVTVTLRARVSNIGNVALVQPFTIRFLYGEGAPIVSDQVVSGTIRGCAAVRTFTIAWPDVTPGAHLVQVLVDPFDDIDEAKENNNKAYGVVMVANSQAFLPLANRER